MLSPLEVVNELPLNPLQTVVDLGCGFGNYSFAISQKVGPTGRVYAVDVDKEILESVYTRIGELRAHNVIPIYADAEHSLTEIPASSCDIVFINNVLGYNDNYHAIISNALFTLRDNGKIIVLDYTKQIAEKIPHRDVLIDEDLLLASAQAHNIRLSTQKKVGDYRTMWIFSKN